MISRMRDSLFGRRTQEADTEAVIVGSLSGTTDPEALKIQPDVKPASGSIQESFEKKNKKPWVLGVVAALVLIGVAIYFGVTSNARNSSNNSSNNNNSLGNLTDSISNSVNLTSANINITFSTANTAKPNPKIAKAFAASTQIPGNLPLAQTPQFITLTGDDAVQQRTFAAFTPILQSFRNPNGCFLPATYFVSNTYTEYRYITELYRSGSEIAVHTVNHVNLGNGSIEQARAEIQSSFTITHNLGGVPSSSLIGFRHPFLSYNVDTFKILKALGFTYDSSVSVNPVTTPYWPHTLDEGLPYPTINCPSCPVEAAKTGFVVPGLWEIPMYTLMVAGTSPPQIWTAMDPVTDADFLVNLQASFDLHYRLKLPFGLYQHFFLYIPAPGSNRGELLKTFIKWTQDNYKDVWYVTNTQLLQWISNPVPVDAMSGFLNLECGKDQVGAKFECPVGSPGLRTCSYGGGTYLFESCFACPTAIPSVQDPIQGLADGVF